MLELAKAPLAHGRAGRSHDVLRSGRSFSLSLLSLSLLAFVPPAGAAESLEALEAKVERLEKLQTQILGELDSLRRAAAAADAQERETEETAGDAAPQDTRALRQAVASLQAEAEQRRKEDAATEQAVEGMLETIQLRQELDTRLLERRIDQTGRPKTGFLSRGFAGGFAVDVSGYIKTDMNWASQELQDGDLLLFARSDNTPFDESQFSFSTRETLISLHFQGPKILGGKAGGKIEMDFFGDITGLDAGANIAQPRANLRAAFMDLMWQSEEKQSTTRFSLGLDHTPFGNYFPELFTFAKAVDSGTYFLLAPMARFTHARRFEGGHSVRIDLAAARSTSGVFGIGGGLNTGNNLIGVGEQSGTPEFQGTISYSNDALGTAPFWGVPTPFTIGISGLFGEERLINFAGIPGNSRTFDKFGFDVKLFVPLIGSTTGDPAGTLFLKGYGSIQQNLNEGVGTGLQGIVVKEGGNPADVGDFESADAIGGWLELGYYLRRDLFLTTMVGTLDVDDNDGVVEGFPFPSPFGGLTSISDNLRYTAGIKKWFGNFLTGVEYTRLHTDFQDGSDGTTHNVLWATYFFF